MENPINELREFTFNFMNNEALDNFWIQYQYDSSLLSLLFLHFQIERIKEVRALMDETQMQQYTGLMCVIYWDIILEYVGEWEYNDDATKGLSLNINDFEINLYDEIYQVIINSEINIYDHIYTILKYLKEDQKIEKLLNYERIHIKAYCAFLMMKESYNFNMDFSIKSLDNVFECCMEIYKKFDKMPEDMINNIWEMLAAYVSVIFLRNFDSANLVFSENEKDLKISIWNNSYDISNQVYKNMSRWAVDDIRSLFMSVK